MQVGNEVREATTEPGVLEIPADNAILHRKAITEIGSGVSLDILAREDETSGDHPQGVRVLPPLTR